MDRRITTTVLRTQGKQETDINQCKRQIQPNEKGETHTIMHWKDKDLYYNKGFIFKVSKRWVFFFWSFVFLILYFERKGDNLHRIGWLLFSYHWFLYQEIVIIFSQSRITSGPEDWDVTVSDSFRDIKNISHLEINPSVENPYKTLGTAAVQNTGVRRARGLGLRIYSKCDLEDESWWKGCYSCLKLVPTCRTRGYAFFFNMTSRCSV